MNTTTVKTVIDTLECEGLLPDRKPLDQFFARDLGNKIAAIGTVSAAFLSVVVIRKLSIVLFLFVYVFVRDFGIPSIIIGSLYLVVARVAYGCSETGLWRFFGLAMSLSGLYFLREGGDTLIHTQGGRLGFHALLLCLLWVFRDPLLRASWVSVSMVYWIGVLTDQQAFAWLSAMMIGTLAGAVLLFWRDEGNQHKLLAHVLALSAISIAFYLSVLADGDRETVWWWTQPGLLAIGLGMLSVLLWRISFTLSGALIVLTLIAHLTSPAVLVSLVSVVLACSRRERLLLGLSAASSVIAVIAFFYQMGASLPVTGIRLIATGAILLLCFGLLKLRGRGRAGSHPL